METFDINGILKTHDDDCMGWGFHTIATPTGYEVGLEMLLNGTPSHVECGSGATYHPMDANAFPELMRSECPIGRSCMMFLAYRAYSFKRRVHTIAVLSV